MSDAHSAPDLMSVLPRAGRVPDFIIGGAPRSGTTWLYEVLDRHPGVYMAKPVRPEPKFFLVDEVYERGIDYYSRTWFREIPDDVRAGEKSTNYLESTSAANRIHRHLPQVKLIFILREPADRALSNWRWSRMNGFESLQLQEALQQESVREANYRSDQKFSRPYSYYSRGLYRRMLQPYVDLFGLDQILCLRYEDIVADPASLAEAAHRFLEIEIRRKDVLGVGQINPSQEKIADPEVMSDLRSRYEGPNRELAEMLGHRFAVWET